VIAIADLRGDFERQPAQRESCTAIHPKRGMAEIY